MKKQSNMLSYVVFCLGVLLSVLVAVSIGQLREQSIQEQIKGDMQSLAHQVDKALQIHLEALQGLQGLFAGSDRVEAAEFDRVSRSVLARHPALLSFQWAQSVPDRQREDFVRRQRENNPRYQLLERGDEGGWITARQRPFYYPVRFQAQQNKAADRPGYDLMSEARIRAGVQSLQQAQTRQRDDVPALIVAPVGERQSALKEVVALQATGRLSGSGPSANDGLLVVRFTLEGIMRQAMTGIQTSGLHMALIDLDRMQGGETTVLYARTPVTRAVSDLQQRYPISDVGQRQWQLVVAPSEGYMAERKSELAYIVMLAGLLISGLLAAYLRMKTRRQLEVESVSAERHQALMEANKQLAHLSQTDGLTQIANRRFFDESYSQEWKRTLREQQPLSLVLFDLDFFKQYNDQYGHLQGDECLRSIAELVGSVINRPGDLFARFGGEEFILLLPNTPREGAMMVANQCRELVESLAIPHRPSAVASVVTVSVGVSSLVPDRTLSAHDLLDLADQALYCAKDRGRNRVVNANDEGFSPR